MVQHANFLRGRWWIAAALGAILLVGLWRVLDRAQPAPADTAKASSPDPVVRPAESLAVDFQVRTVEARRGQVSLSLHAVGEVLPTAEGKVEIRAPAPGLILFEGPAPQVGQKVKNGQTLAVIEHQYIVHDYVHLFPQRWDVQSKALEAKRRLSQAEVEFERAKKLFELRLIAERDLKLKEAEYQEAQAASQGMASRLALLDTQLQKSQPVRRPLVTPIAGTLSSANFYQGQMAYEGDPLFTVVSLTDLWVQVYLRPEDLLQIQGQNEAYFRTASFPDESFVGRLRSIEATVDAQQRRLRAIYQVANPQERLRLGMVMDAYLHTSGKFEGLLIPRAAVLEDEGSFHLFVRAADGGFERRRASLGRESTELVEVTAGVQEGGQVAVEQLRELRAAFLNAQAVTPGQ